MTRWTASIECTGAETVELRARTVDGLPADHLRIAYTGERLGAGAVVSGDREVCVSAPAGDPLTVSYEGVDDANTELSMSIDDPCPPPPTAPPVEEPLEGATLTIRCEQAGGKVWAELATVDGEGHPLVLDLYPSGSDWPEDEVWPSANATAVREVRDPSSEFTLVYAGPLGNTTMAWGATDNDTCAET